MSVFGPAADDVEQKMNGVSKDYINAQDDLVAAQHVLKAGDTMRGILQMSGNRVAGVANPTNSEDAATKNYVNAAQVKPLIMIWAEGRGRIEQFDYSYSFGDGVEGHNRSGYPMLAAGRVLHMGLMAISGQWAATPCLQSDQAGRWTFGGHYLRNTIWSWAR